MLNDLWYSAVNVVRSAAVAAGAIGAATFVIVFVAGTVKEVIDYRKIGWWR